MENIFEILVAISVVWSVISSFKKKQQPNSQKTTSSQPDKINFESLFSDLKEGFQEQVNPQVNNNTELEFLAKTDVQQEEPIPLAHKFPKHEKRGFGANNPNKRFAQIARKTKRKTEFEDAINHEHFDTDLTEHHLLEATPEVQKIEDQEIEIDVSRMFDTQEIREAVLLSEILDKPMSLRPKR